MLTFDEELHEYRWDGIVKPSVTQCLSRLHDFGMVAKDVMEAACVRGSYVHSLCEYHDQNDLDPSSVGIYQGYLDAWIRFCADYKANWAGIEVRGYSERYGFAGTWDRHGLLNGMPWVVDVKTSVASHPVWGLQTAAYRQLLAERDPYWLLARRATVQLKPDGTYKVIEWNSPDDLPVFLALISLINWSNKS
jgi:hypothetical protein